jgi:hypothetical protein
MNFEVSLGNGRHVAVPVGFTSKRTVTLYAGGGIFDAGTVVENCSTPLFVMLALPAVLNLSKFRLPLLVMEALPPLMTMPEPRNCRNAVTGMSKV